MGCAGARRPFFRLSLLSLSYNKCLSYNKSVPLEIVTLHASSALIYILVSTYLIRNKSVSMKCPCRLVLSYSTATHSVVPSGNVHIASHARASSWQLLFLHVKSRSRTVLGWIPYLIWPPGVPLSCTYCTQSPTAPAHQNGVRVELWVHTASGPLTVYYPACEEEIPHSF